MHDEYQTHQFWNNMKKSELKQLIKEEFKQITNEALDPEFEKAQDNLYQKVTGEKPGLKGLNKFRTKSEYEINGKDINLSSVELEGMESYDHPDYSDAYVSYAEFNDGTPLNIDELDELNDKYGNSIVQDKLFL